MKEKIDKIFDELVKANSSVQKIPQYPYCISKTTNEKGLILKAFIKLNNWNYEELKTDINQCELLKTRVDEVNYTQEKDGEKKIFKYSGEIVYLPSEEEIKVWVKKDPSKNTQILMNSSLAPLAMDIIASLQTETSDDSYDEIDEKLDNIFANMIEDDDDEFQENEETIIDSKFQEMLKQSMPKAEDEIPEMPKEDKVNDESMNNIDDFDSILQDDKMDQESDEIGDLNELDDIFLENDESNKKENPKNEVNDKPEEETKEVILAPEDSKNTEDNNVNDFDIKIEDKKNKKEEQQFKDDFFTVDEPKKEIEKQETIKEPQIKTKNEEKNKEIEQENPIKEKIEKPEEEPAPREKPSFSFSERRKQKYKIDNKKTKKKEKKSKPKKEKIKKEKVKKEGKKSNIGLLIGIILIIVVIFGAGYYFITKHFINKKENLVAVNKKENNVKIQKVIKSNNKKVEERITNKENKATNLTPQLQEKEFYIVVEACSKKEYADEDVAKLKKEGYLPQILTVNVNGKTMYRVVAKVVKGESKANEELNKLKSNTEWKDAYKIVKEQ